MNEQVVKGQWNDLKGRIRQRWASVSEGELQEIEGDIDRLIGLLQRKTGESRERIERAVEDMADAARSNAQAARVKMEQAGQQIRNAGHQAAEHFQEHYDEMADQARAQYERAEMAIQRRPAESVAVAFGAGVACGLIIGLCLRSP